MKFMIAPAGMVMPTDNHHFRRANSGTSPIGGGGYILGGNKPNGNIGALFNFVIL